MGVFERKGIFWIDYYVHGRRKRESIGPSKTLAKIVLRKRKVEIAEGKFLSKKEQRIKFTDFSNLYIENYAKKKRSWETTDIHYLKKLIPYFGNKYLQEITPFLVQKYQIERRGQNTYKGRLVSVAYVNRELACLKCMFSRAVEWGYLTENPVKKIKFEKENNKRVRFLEKEELRKLIHCADEPLKPVIMLAVNTGMRLNEIQFLKWKDIDSLRGLFILRETKNGETRRVPINRTVREILFNLPQKDLDAYIFCKKDGMPYNFRSPFLRAIQRAGIVDFHFHDLRHTAASYLAMAGVDLNTIREILGHKSMNMVLRYAHLSPAHQANAISVLDKQMDTFWTPGPNLEITEKNREVVTSLDIIPSFHGEVA